MVPLGVRTGCVLNQSTVRKKIQNNKTRRTVISCLQIQPNRKSSVGVGLLAGAVNDAAHSVLSKLWDPFISWGPAHVASEGRLCATTLQSKYAGARRNGCSLRRTLLRQAPISSRHYFTSLIILPRPSAICQALFCKNYTVLQGM